MAYTITFETSKFDVSKEIENPINPIYGYSLLIWFKNNCKEQIEISKPNAEDWGWYSICNYKDRNYILGASVYYKKGDNPTKKLKWVFQVEKDRSVIEKILRKEKMHKDDECLAYFYNILKSDKEIINIEIE